MSYRKPPAKRAGDSGAPQPATSQLFARAVSLHLDGQSVGTLRLYALPRMSAQARLQGRMIPKCVCDPTAGQGECQDGERKGNLCVHSLDGGGFRTIPENRAWMREVSRFLGLGEGSLRKYTKSNGHRGGFARQKSVVVFGTSR